MGNRKRKKVRVFSRVEVESMVLMLIELKIYLCRWVWNLARMLLLLLKLGGKVGFRFFREE